jgi:serine/threonine-protein phosphatase 5
VLARYDEELYDMVQATFELLPLGAVVDEKIFVLHGGLFDSPDVSLEEICK